MVESTCGLSEGELTRTAGWEPKRDGPAGRQVAAVAQEDAGMGHPTWNGRVEVDIRDSEPDWTPFLQPKAPKGAPNVLMIIWDDVGYGAMDVFGGPIETPTMRRIADLGLRYSNFHTTALCSPTRSSLLTGRNATSNNMACITEASAGFPGFSARIPFENGTIAEVLNERGWNTYAIGKWHLTPGG